MAEAAPKKMPKRIWTVGHWTCPEEKVLANLAGPGIELLVDVRAQPGSRRSPQFSRDVLPGWLGAAGVDYVHLGELAGRRRKQQIDASINAGWRNQSFHNYADHTLTPEFADGLARLERLATERRTVLMCGEPMPWRCHRLLIANVLAARGWEVEHLMTDAPALPHVLGQWGAEPVVDEDAVVTYPAAPDPPAPDHTPPDAAAPTTPPNPRGIE